MPDPKDKILLCVCGGIAAYKAIDLASRLIKAGYHVRTVLTPSAQELVSPINFSAITHERVYRSLWEEDDPIPHITLADWADLIVVAPATANTIAKAAHGIADNLLSSLLLAHTKPVLWIPAMNVNMYQNPVTRENLDKLKSLGHHVLEPATGMLACGYEGQGKYPPNAEVVAAIACYIKHGEDIKGKKVLVTAGATEEAIDPMRTISNKSSGRMGIALARALALRGADVVLVYARISVEIPYFLHTAIEAVSVREMHKAVMKYSGSSEWIIKCAAVSDYAPSETSKQKIKKGKAISMELTPTVDILAELGKKKKRGQKLIGFAAETQNLVANAQAKLKNKNLDMVVVNHLDNVGRIENEIRIISHGDTTGKLLCASKEELAHTIIDRIMSL